ncbi:hypothetical protein N7533_013773 [Penicillium manginii]|uniref:uncharacterized protein n=1 Tax=Penicillium manginii TaxID=203109 RepID=UPI002546C53C|nr:uncharacterized protein N7533_013773 [Penicillium manginii]KAJ5733326.1 hypothetical protein N7533_013773 [Penicillium manginii]
MDNHRVGTVLWSSGSNNWRKEMADQERRRVGRTTPSCPSHELQWLNKVLPAYPVAPAANIKIHVTVTPPIILGLRSPVLRTVVARTNNLRAPLLLIDISVPVQAMKPLDITSKQTTNKEAVPGGVCEAEAALAKKPQPRQK